MNEAVSRCEKTAAKQQAKKRGTTIMTSNRGVVYMGSGKVEVRSIDFPKFVTPTGRQIDHGAIIRPFATNICGSDQHMVRGRTTAPVGMVLGHEITGEVIEVGHDVEFIKK